MKMKKILLLFVLLGLPIVAITQITTWPSVDRMSSKTSRQFSRSGGGIKRVKVTPDETTIVINCGQYGICMSPKTYIEYVNSNNGSKERLRITKLTWEDGNSPLQLGESHNVQFAELHFPSIPNGVNLISMIEPDGWELYDIHITPTSNKPLPRIAETETEIKQLIDDSHSKLSGFYEMMEGNGYRLALLHYNDTIRLVYINQDKGEIGSWKCGEVKAVLRPTAVKSIYKADYYRTDKIKTTAVITFDLATMGISVDGRSPDVYVRMGEIVGTDEIGNNTFSEVWTGTGFAMGDGYIVTNNHVVDEAKVIYVKGIQGDLNVGLSAELVATDKANDIAIIKITDNKFNGFGPIPYSISSTMANVGEEVFVLGYPLTQALGKEIKLTNGIVSSRTGYQGDISTYQISAPVQPGNSGGPMFDNDGSVIGIVVAGVPGAENVGYAIKTSYLQILIESAGINIKLPNNNTISLLSLADKVKRVKDFVFYIECSK